MKRTPASAKRLGGDFSKPLTLRPVQNQKSFRWDLKIRLASGVGTESRNTNFHRVMGLVLKKTLHDLLGRKLRRPKKVDPAHWEEYEVDHRNKNNLDCRLVNLRPLHKGKHRGAGKKGWNKRKQERQLEDKVKRLKRTCKLLARH